MSETQPRQQRKADAAFFIITSALLVVIIVLLAALWLRAQRRAFAAEMKALRLQQQQRGAELLLRALQEGRLAPVLDRDRLKRSTVNLDGREVHALRLPPDLAEALGLRPGDVVIVERRAVATTGTAPSDAAAATRPAAASGPGAEPTSP